MVYKLVTDQLLKNLINEVNCVKNNAVASCYVPVNSSDPNGALGQISYDANYIYIKVAATTWKRVATSSF